MDAAVHVDGLLKVFDVPEREPGLVAATKSLVRRKTKDVRAVDEISFRIEPGEVVGFLGPERRGQDDDAEDALGPPLSDGRRGARPRSRAVEAAARVPEPDHARHGEPQPAAVGPARARLVRAQPRDLPHPARRVRPDARRAHRAARHRRPRAQADPPALARRADEGRDRRRAAPPAAGALPRRADDRPRRDDAEANPHVRRRLQRALRRDRAPHEPLHGRRRGAVQARRRHPSRADPVRRRRSPASPTRSPRTRRSASPSRTGKRTSRATARSSTATATGSRCACRRPRRRASPRACSPRSRCST